MSNTEVKPPDINPKVNDVPIKKPIGRDTVLLIRKSKLYFLPRFCDPRQRKKNNNKPKNRISESEALNKLNILINQGEKSNIAARKVAEETGYERKWLYSKLHKRLDK